jgi:NADPH2:quinone reductase
VIAAVNPVRPEGGAQSQHIVVPAASVVPVPEGVSLAQASILLMTGLTALNALQIAAGTVASCRLDFDRCKDVTAKTRFSK